MSTYNTKNKLLVPLIITIIAGVGLTGAASGMWLNKRANYEDLYMDYAELVLQYELLVGDYEDLEVDYDTLQDAYDALESELNAFETIVSQAILPVQYSIFAESVRRNYLPDYLDGKTGKPYWTSFVEYCRDIVLHDSDQYNSFQAVSNAFADALAFGSDTMYLADYIMYWTYYSWLPNWDGFGLSGTELQNIDDVHQWCVDEIEYEYDSDIDNGQTNFDYDYIKFPVETVFRTMGDCEDQAILDAAYLESCGYETAIAVFHDEAHPVYGEFYHGTLLVHIEDTSAFFSAYPSCPLWHLGSTDPYEDYTWCWLDPTWDVTFGGVPSWLQDYRDASGISSSFCSIVICDIFGSVF